MAPDDPYDVGPIIPLLVFKTIGEFISNFLGYICECRTPTVLTGRGRLWAAAAWFMYDEPTPGLAPYDAANAACIY